MNDSGVRMILSAQSPDDAHMGLVEFREWAASAYAWELRRSLVEIARFVFSRSGRPPIVHCCWNALLALDWCVRNTPDVSCDVVAEFSGDICAALSEFGGVVPRQCSVALVKLTSHSLATLPRDAIEPIAAACARAIESVPADECGTGFSSNPHSSLFVAKLLKLTSSVARELPLSSRELGGSVVRTFEVASSRGFLSARCGDCRRSVLLGDKHALLRMCCRRFFEAAISVAEHSCCTPRGHTDTDFDVGADAEARQSLFSSVVNRVLVPSLETFLSTRSGTAAFELMMVLGDDDASVARALGSSLGMWERGLVVPALDPFSFLAGFLRTVDFDCSVVFGLLISKETPEFLYVFTGIMRHMTVGCSADAVRDSFLSEVRRGGSGSTARLREMLIALRGCTFPFNAAPLQRRIEAFRLAEFNE